MPNKVGERGQPFVTPMVLRIGPENPYKGLNLPTTVSYNLIIAAKRVAEIPMSFKCKKEPHGEQSQNLCKSLQTNSRISPSGVELAQ